MEMMNYVIVYKDSLNVVYSEDGFKQAYKYRETAQGECDGMNDEEGDIYMVVDTLETRVNYKA